MPVKYRSEVRGDCLHVTAEGTVDSVDEMLNYIDKMRSELEKSGVFKLWVDEKKCHMHVGFKGLQDVAQALKEPRWFLEKLQIAVLSSSVNHPLFQHVFDPVGRIKVFMDEKEAKEWFAEA